MGLGLTETYLDIDPALLKGADGKIADLKVGYLTTPVNSKDVTGGLAKAIAESPAVARATGDEPVAKAETIIQSGE